MKDTDIRKYAELMRELGLTRLEIAEEGLKIHLERSACAVEKESAYSYVPENRTSESAKAKETGYIRVKSPLVGVFYMAPAENAAPYVSVGDKVKKGQTLCIVEAMKLMNEITADEDGEILEICVSNGQVVEYGTELFHIRRQMHE